MDCWRSSVTVSPAIPNWALPVATEVMIESNFISEIVTS